MSKTEKSGVDAASVAAAPSLEKKACVVIGRPNFGEAGYTLFLDSADMHDLILEELGDSDIGDVITLRRSEMTEAEFAALPEFQGW